MKTTKNRSRFLRPTALTLTAVVFLFSLGAPASQTRDDAKVAPLKSRTFLFTYTATVAKLPKGKTVKLWLPLPQSSPDQDVTLQDAKLTAGGMESIVGTDPMYGNKSHFFQMAPQKDDGTLTVSNTFKVTRREVLTANNRRREPAVNKTIDRFLQADKLVPLGGKPLELVKDAPLGPTQLETARTFYNLVNRHMRYSKEGTGWGNGDAVWACDSKFGNCSDFHSLFIALARSYKIPAKFEMGFSIPKKRGEGTIGGYHCWAWFLPDGKVWVPVDISEANRFPEMRDFYFGNLTEDRVAFTTGRDIELQPKQAGPPLNFFIYPYGELDGQPLPAGRIQQSFTYQDVRVEG
jgi:hypothetical protein